jgi:hypothetical protein
LRNYAAIIFGMSSAFSVCLLLSLLSAQSAMPQAPGTSAPINVPKEALELKGLEKLPGKVPTRYVSGAKDRAAAYQRSLEAAQTWFSNQLGISVPTTLFFLDKEDYGRIRDGSSWPVAYSEIDKRHNVIIFPTQVEELVGEESRAKLPGEYILFHEAGHNFARRLGIDSGNSWVNELIANMFMAAYIQEKRPDLMWVSEGPEAHDFKPIPHYTSLRDLDYLYYEGVGAPNYVWYQLEIQLLAQFLVKGQSFPEVVRLLKTAFPAVAHTQETLEQVAAHLDTIRPRSADVLKPLYGPSIVRQIRPVACRPGQESATTGRAIVAVRNDTMHPIVVTSPDGTHETLAPARWDTFSLPSAGVLKLSDDRCILAEDTSVLAVVTEP